MREIGLLGHFREGTNLVRVEGHEPSGVHCAVPFLVCFPSSHGLYFLTNPSVVGSGLCTNIGCLPCAGTA